MTLHQNDTMAPCAIYARTARENATEIDRQVQACASRASELGAEVQHLFIDNGASGLKIGDSLQHLLDTARVGAFKCLIVSDSDRLARSMGLRLFVLGELAAAGVEVEMVSQPRESNAIICVFS